MGLGTKIFIIEDDDSICPLPLKKYERLKDEKSDEKLPQYAGSRLRCAYLIVEYINRKPDAILHTNYYFIDFDSFGRIDQSERENEIRLAVNMAASIQEEQTNVIKAEHHFARKKYKERYTWTPSQDLKNKIFSMVFGITI